MKKILVSISVLVIFATTGFYFWASSSFNDQSQYDQVVTYGDSLKRDYDTLSVLSYNIGYLSGMTNNLSITRKESLFSGNFERAVNLLEPYNFDFIGLQEVDFNSARSFTYNQFDSLGKYLNFGQGAYSVNWDKSYVPFPYFPINIHFGRMYSGQGILSKSQILSNELVVLDKPFNTPFYYDAFYLDRVLQISKVQVGADTLIIMNVHLEAFDKETRESQAQIVLEVFNNFAKEFPVILMGDFNSRPPFATSVGEAEKSIKIFLDCPFIGEAIDKDRYLKNESRFFTFNSEDPYERLDYIFYNNNKIRKIDSDVLRDAEDISDHLPVWMTFAIIK
ncbi:endonuclease/exonuclease/phosphatase family protein [uncultured Marivirga sp.]|uniref:endonuclease/exonuclease/phosphatase family protein n=1 Tax=uncultured Marivirga sp. TaxID=1123707 RepID=UPI0030EDCA8F|tara:strand:+ start:29370 stop:30374 length:1005 start_codon:yes stop_codon:yes gene_type:complete